MAGNSFGNIFKLSSFGESHGKALGGIIDGCPAGVDIDLDFINKELNRRRPGQSEIVTQRKEDDSVEFLSGIFEGKTTGTPIGFIIVNKDQKSKETTINSINDKLNKLQKNLSDLSAAIETLSKDLKDREIRYKTEKDTLSLTQKRLTKSETDLGRSQEHYAGLKEIKEKAIKERDDKISVLERQLEELKNQYENLRNLQKDHKQALNELLNIRKSIENQKA